MVRRPLGGYELPTVDPFLMLDHFGPVLYKPGEAIGAPDHPHRGFETVTYILSGGVHHQDSQGNEGNLEAGWVQWMTAGSGVIHSEMPTAKLLREGGESEGFQLWVNLPAKDKMIAPRYQDTSPDKIPKVKTEDNLVEVSVIAGESLGCQAVIDTRTPIIFLDVHLKPNGELIQPIPSQFNCFLYVYRGKGLFGEEETQASMGQAVVVSDGTHVKLKGSPDSECKVLVLAGQPLNEPIARHGPFVMNTQQEIQKAFQDFYSGKFGEIEGSEARRAATEAAKEQQKQTGRWDQL